MQLSSADAIILFFSKKSSKVAKKYFLYLAQRPTVYKTGVLTFKNFLLTFVLTHCYNLQSSWNLTAEWKWNSFSFYLLIHVEFMQWLLKLIFMIWKVWSYNLPNFLDQTGSTRMVLMRGKHSLSSHIPP